jgi:hypothetical protein
MGDDNGVVVWVFHLCQHYTILVVKGQVPLSVFEVVAIRGFSLYLLKMEEVGRDASSGREDDVVPLGLTNMIS